MSLPVSIAHQSDGTFRAAAATVVASVEGPAQNSRHAEYLEHIPAGPDRLGERGLPRIR
jgi:hypothetical protein